MKERYGKFSQVSYSCESIVFA